MKCISIRQPWAWLIVRPDLAGEARAAALAAGLIKTIENRIWHTPYRGPVLIHAAKGMTRGEYDSASGFAYAVGVDEVPAPEALDRGGIVGVANLIDCVHPANRTSDWHMGDQYGFLLQDTRPLPFFPYTGALQLFEVPASAYTPPQEPSPHA